VTTLLPGSVQEKSVSRSPKRPLRRKLVTRPETSIECETGSPLNPGTAGSGCSDRVPLPSSWAHPVKTCSGERGRTGGVSEKTMPDHSHASWMTRCDERIARARWLRSNRVVYSCHVFRLPDASGDCSRITRSVRSIFHRTRSHELLRQALILATFD
jgi:hypothetical protein